MFENMLEVRQHNKAMGKYWFSDSSMRFFNSCVGNAVYGGKYFVLSEQMEWNTPRRYSVMEAHKNGDITTVGEFMQYGTWDSAKYAIDKLLRVGSEG